MRAHSGGKVILLGEHAVLYGVPAFACAIADGVTATFDHELPTPDAGASKPLHFIVDGKPLNPAPDSPLANGLAIANDYARQNHIVGTLTLVSRIPPGGGLGWSAAFANVTSRILFAAHGHTSQNNTANDHTITNDHTSAQHLAARMEDAFHGRASGLDLATVCSDRLIRFSLVNGTRTVTPLPVLPPGVAVIAATPPASTAKMVAGVATFVVKNPAQSSATFAALTTIAQDLHAAILARDLSATGACLTRAHEQLQHLDISTPQLDAIVSAALNAGAAGAKLTGAGGGGCAVALCDESSCHTVATAIAPLAQHVRIVRWGAATQPAPSFSGAPT